MEVINLLINYNKIINNDLSQLVENYTEVIYSLQDIFGININIISLDGM